jgi:hypothetical protein
MAITVTANVANEKIGEAIELLNEYRIGEPGLLEALGKVTAMSAPAAKPNRAARRQHKEHT